MAPLDRGKREWLMFEGLVKFVAENAGIVPVLLLEEQAGMSPKRGIRTARSSQLVWRASELGASWYWKGRRGFMVGLGGIFGSAVAGTAPLRSDWTLGGSLGSRMTSA